MLAVPFKRSGSRPIEYFDYPEIEAVLASVDRTTADWASRLCAARDDVQHRALECRKSSRCGA